MMTHEQSLRGSERATTAMYTELACHDGGKQNVPGRRMTGVFTIHHGGLCGQIQVGTQTPGHGNMDVHTHRPWGESDLVSKDNWLHMGEGLEQR